MSLLLNKTQSSYYPAFKSMLDSIDTGTNTLSCIVSFFCYLPSPPLHSHPPFHLPLPPPCSSSLSLFSLHYLPHLPPYLYLSLIPPHTTTTTSLPCLPPTTSLLPPTALAEARDISMHLNPLRKHFEAMEEMDYLELPKRFPAVFHLICLVWSHSTHYQQPARIIVLLQEIANLLILLVSCQTSELTL